MSDLIHYEVIKNATNVFVRQFAMGKTSNQSKIRSVVVEIRSLECNYLTQGPQAIKTTLFCLL